MDGRIKGRSEQKTTTWRAERGGEGGGGRQGPWGPQGRRKRVAQHQDAIRRRVLLLRCSSGLTAAEGVWGRWGDSLHRAQFRLSPSVKRGRTEGRGGGGWARVGDSLEGRATPRGWQGCHAEAGVFAIDGGAAPGSAEQRGTSRGCPAWAFGVRALGAPRRGGAVGGGVWGCCAAPPA